MLKLIKEITYRYNLINRFLKINNKRINFKEFEQSLKLTTIILDSPIKLTITLLSSYIVYSNINHKPLSHYLTKKLQLEYQELYLHDLKYGLVAPRSTSWCWDCCTHHGSIHACPIINSVFYRIKIEEKKRDK